MKNLKNGLGGVPQEITGEVTGETVGEGGPRGKQPGAKAASTVQLVSFSPLSFINTALYTKSGSQQVLPFNPNRRYLLIQNDSANTLYVSFDTKASTKNSLVIAANGYYEPLIVPASSVNLRASATGTHVIVVEGY